jgi:deoxyribose-phosphate aldolase
MMLEELGEEYTHPELFRFGCSSLVPDIERQLHYCVYGHYPTTSNIPPA